MDFNVQGLRENQPVIISDSEYSFQSVKITATVDSPCTWGPISLFERVLNFSPLSHR